MTEPRHIVGLSGGKDSVAMSLGLKEREPDRKYEFMCTPTGNELPVMLRHWDWLEQILESPLLRLTGGITLETLIDQQQMLPNFNARWCTRILKIEPTIEFMATLPSGSTLYVGLRADEEERKGIFGEDINIDFPMRRWGWGMREVYAQLNKWGVRIPARSDCAWCYGQRLGEWYALWMKHPEIYEAGVQQEKKFGHTFRSAQRDTWPAALDELREAFKTRGAPKGAEAAMKEYGECRVCRL